MLKRFFLGIVGLLCMALMSCVHNQKIESNWQDLRDAEKLPCGEWPLKEKELAVRKLQAFPLKGGNVFLHAAVQKKDGNQADYRIIWKDSKSLSESDGVLVNTPPQSFVAGYGILGNENVIVIVKNDSLKNLASVEVRSFDAKKVLYQSFPLARQIEDAKIVFTPTGFWMTYRYIDINDKSEGGERLSKIVFLKPQMASRLSSTTFNLSSFPVMPSLVHSPEKGKVIVSWLDESQEKYRVATIVLEETGKFSKMHFLDLEVERQIESWASFVYRNNFYVAVVDGDSLVGIANLNVGIFNYQNMFSKEVIIKENLGKMHMSEPLFYSYNGLLWLSLVKWFDEESTLATYRVYSGMLKREPLRGQFKKGSVVMGSIPLAKAGSSDGFLILRSKREDDFWTYKICEVPIK